MLNILLGNKGDTHDATSLCGPPHQGPQCSCTACTVYIQAADISCQNEKYATKHTQGPQKTPLEAP